MRAVVLRGHGGPEVLSLEDVPDPEPGPDEVLVDVRATALNRADLLQRAGHYPSPVREAYEIPGLELSGTVAASSRSFSAPISPWSLFFVLSTSSPDAPNSLRRRSVELSQSSSEAL